MNTTLDLFIECLNSSNLSQVKMAILRQIKTTRKMTMKDIERIKCELKKITANTNNTAIKKESTLLLRRLSFNYRPAVFLDHRIEQD